MLFLNFLERPCINDIFPHLGKAQRKKRNLDVSVFWSGIDKLIELTPFRSTLMNDLKKNTSSRSLGRYESVRQKAQCTYYLWNCNCQLRQIMSWIRGLYLNFTEWTTQSRSALLSKISWSKFKLTLLLSTKGHPLETKEYGEKASIFIAGKLVESM